MGYTITRGEHGDGCELKRECECGAPVWAKPTTWKAGQPVEWDRCYDPRQAFAQFAAELRAVAPVGTSVDQALELLRAKYPLSRIPPYDPASSTGMRDWFQTMGDRGLLYHPEDPANDVISARTGERLFTDEEAAEADSILAAMFREHGHDVFAAAYPIFMGKPEDAAAD